MLAFIDKVNKTIKKYNLLSLNDKIIVAVSGGADSIALLLFLNSLREKYNLKLSIAHFNHQIRGKEADRDSWFVKKIGKNLGLPFVLEKKDVPAYATRKKLSLEEAARILRYKFLEEVANKEKAKKIALAHNKDDQIETVLMHFLRGSGSRGLGGMPIERKISEEVNLIRPLIETSRQEILIFLKQKKAEFIEDSSNKKTIYLRNRIRQHLIPYLEKYNPKIKQILFNFAETIREENEYLEVVCQEMFERVACYEKKKIILDVDKLLNFHPALKKRILRCAIKTVKGNVKEISYKHWQDLNLLIKKKKGSLVLNLPQLKIEKKYNKLIFSINKRDDFEQSLVSAKATSTLICSKKMKIPGITKLYRIGKEINSSFLERKEDFCLFSKFHQSKDWIEKNNKQVQFFDVDKLRFPLLVRSRLPGDRIQPFGMQSKDQLILILIKILKISKNIRSKVGGT